MSSFVFNFLQDQFDTIDLSDNEIVKLENVPYLNRLGTLIINNNRITRINPSIGGTVFELWTAHSFLYFPHFSDLVSSVIFIAEFLPKLHTLVLTNNRIVNLVEIDPLASIPKLQYLSLLDNNITKKPNYRLYVINKLKSLRVLDFKKVKNKVMYIFHYPYYFLLGLLFDIRNIGCSVSVCVRVISQHFEYTYEI